MRISTMQLFRQGIENIHRQQSLVAATQREVASGKRIETAADDPAGATRLLELRQSLALTRQFVKNAELVTGRLSLEETALASTGNLLQRVRELAVQANSGALDSANHRAIAIEINERLGELNNCSEL